MEHRRIQKRVTDIIIRTGLPVAFKVDTSTYSVKIHLIYQYPDQSRCTQVLDIGKYSFNSMTDELLREKIKETWIKIKEMASQKSPEIEEHLSNGKLISKKRGVRYYFEEEIKPWKIEYTE
jgi:hypothetical protein